MFTRVIDIKVKDIESNSQRYRNLKLKLIDKN